MRRQGGEKLPPTRDGLLGLVLLGRHSTSRKRIWASDGKSRGCFRDDQETGPLHCRAASTSGFVPAIVPE